MTSIFQLLETPRSRAVLVGTFVVLAAVGAGLAGARPTGSRAADVVWSALLAASVSFAASKAHRRTWLFLVGVTMVAASGWALLPAGLAVLGAVVGVTAPRRSAVLGAAVGALSIQVLIRLDLGVFHGASAIVTAIAVLPVLVSGYSETRFVVRQRVNLGLKLILGLGTIVVAAYAIALLLAASDVDSGVSGSRSALRYTRDGETDSARQELRTAVTQLNRADGLLNGAWALPARSVPILGQHAQAVGLFVRDGSALVGTASRSIGAVDYEAMKYKSGRLDLDRIREAQQPLTDAAEAAATFDDDLSTIDASWLVPQLQNRIDSYRGEVRDASRDAALAAEVAEVAPGLLGGEGTRHYFIAFVTPAEQRGSGGFIGSYGELTAEQGKVRLTRSGPVADLIQAAPVGARTLSGPADYLARYGPYNPADHFQDLTFSPNFPSTAAVIEELYPQSGGRAIDGVLQVDPYGLAALLRLTGPIHIDGIDKPLTADNAAKVLLRDQYALFNDGADQEVALSAAAKATFEKLTTGNLPSPSRMSAVLDPMVEQGRFKFHSIREDEQRLMARIGLDWALPAPAGDDFLALTTQNNGNSKIDVFQHRSIDYRVKIDPKSGDIAATALIEVENRAPTSGQPDVVLRNGRGLPVGTSRVWLSIYTPLTLDHMTIGDLRLRLKPEREGGYNVYGAFVNVGPGETLRIRFQLRGHTDTPSSYRLDVFPQPTVNPDQLTVTVDGGAPATRATGMKARGKIATTTFAGTRERTLTSSFGR